MTFNQYSGVLRRACRILLAGALLLTSQVWSDTFTGGEPLAPQPDGSSLKPGLSVSYFFKYFDHIDELDSRPGSVAGEPLVNLDHVAFEDGKVLTTDRPMGVGAHIRGLIHLQNTGTYTLKLQSNDGVKLIIGGVLLHTDPEIHAARWSPDLVYQVNSAGWYEFKLNYYQRKGTSALRLKWTPPQGEEEIVPPEAFSYR